MLFSGGGQEAPDAVRLPSCGLHNFDQGRAFGPSDQFQDFRALALGSRRAGFFGAGLAAFFPAFVSFFGAALVLAPLAAFWPLGAPFFWLAPFL
jgi:hypothetical protein